jgi:hypothetical protein
VIKPENINAMISSAAYMLLTIPADIHHTVTSLPPEVRRDRAKVNEALRMVQETAGGNSALHRP